MSTPLQIGTVEVLRLRTYADSFGNDVTVQPGIYPLVMDQDKMVYWTMEGEISEYFKPDFTKVGDGMFIVHPGGDKLSGEKTTVNSPRFDPSKWAELVQHPIANPGPEQRIVISLKDPWA